MFAIWCLLVVVIGCSLCLASILWYIVSCALFDVCCLLFASCWLSLGVCCLLFAAIWFCYLSVGCCMLYDVSSSVFRAACFSFLVNCLV